MSVCLIIVIYIVQENCLVANLHMLFFLQSFFLTLVSAFVIGDAPQPPSSAQPSHSPSSDFLPGPIYNLAQSGPLVAGKSLNEEPCFRLCV